MKNFDEFIRNCEDGMATLDEILVYFKDYKVYGCAEACTPSNIDDIYVVDDNNEVVASFVAWWDEDDGEPIVHRLDDIWTHENFDDLTNRYLDDGCKIKMCHKGGNKQC